MDCSNEMLVSAFFRPVSLVKSYILRRNRLHYEHGILTLFLCAKSQRCNVQTEFTLAQSHNWMLNRWGFSVSFSLNPMGKCWARVKYFRHHIDANRLKIAVQIGLWVLNHSKMSVCTGFWRDFADNHAMALGFRRRMTFWRMILTMATLLVISSMTTVNSHLHLDLRTCPFFLCRRIEFPTRNRPFLASSQGVHRPLMFHCRSAIASAFSPDFVRPLSLHWFLPTMK